jgi:DNA-binding transcriptional MerR regulator
MLAGVTPMTVTRWARSGKLPAGETVGGNRRYEFHHVRALLADLGRPIPPWLEAVPDPGINPAALRVVTYELEDLGQLAADLATLEAWFREDCTSDHAEDMAAVVRRAGGIVTDLIEARS